MIKIFKDKGNGQCMVQTNCLSADEFTMSLAEALGALNGQGTASDFLEILSVAMPIAYKLSGYKADTVREERSLACGIISPSASALLVSIDK